MKNRYFKIKEYGIFHYSTIETFEYDKDHGTWFRMNLYEGFDGKYHKFGCH